MKIAIDKMLVFKQKDNQFAYDFNKFFSIFIKNLVKHFKESLFGCGFSLSSLTQTG